MRLLFTHLQQKRKGKHLTSLSLPPPHTHTSPSLPSALYLLAEWFTVTCLVNEIPRCLEGGTVNPSRAELVVIIVLQRRQVEVAQILSQKHTHTLSSSLPPPHPRDLYVRACVPAFSPRGLHRTGFLSAVDYNMQSVSAWVWDGRGSLQCMLCLSNSELKPPRTFSFFQLLFPFL